MRRRRRTAPVPQDLVADIATALERVRKTESALRDVIAHGDSRLERRQRHAELGAAYLAADRLLREATRLAKPHSYVAWSHWRRQLSQLDLARQIHLFQEQDDSGVLGLGDVRAVDTGMSGPAIGDLLHGRSRSPGTPPRYGLDVEEVLATADTARPARRTTPEPQGVIPPPVAEVTRHRDPAMSTESAGGAAPRSSTAAA